MTDVSETIAIVGAGSIGTAWAILFASTGLRASIFDIDADRRAASRGELAARLADLKDTGLLDDEPSICAALIAYGASLAETVAGATYVQECIAENADAKRALFAELDALTPRQTILASSSSFLPASSFAGDLQGRERCLVVHPGNPPYLLRVVEIVPAPFTTQSATGRAADLMACCGLAPIHVRRECLGFAFNRLQGALLREAYALVEEGTVAPGDIDRLVRDGLGLRWSLIGPFETADLNTRGGIAAHAERMLPSYLRMARQRGEVDAGIAAPAIAQVVAERRRALPLADWGARAAWRDRELMALLAHRRRRG